jgi:hypothetical protein
MEINENPCLKRVGVILLDAVGGIHEIFTQVFGHYDSNIM